MKRILIFLLLAICNRPVASTAQESNKTIYQEVIEKGVSRIVSSYDDKQEYILELEIQAGYGVRLGDFSARLSPLSKLKYLSSYGGRVTSEDLRVISSLYSLTHLELNEADIADSDVAKLKGLKHLRRLELIRNHRLTDACISEIAKLPDLGELHLHYAKVTDNGLKALSRAPSLKVLHLGNIPMTGEAFSVFDNLPLEELSISETRLGDDSAVHLKKLKSLNCLSLTFVKLGDSGLKSICGLPKLSKMRLVGLHVTDESIDDMARMVALRELYLEACLISDEGIRRLRKMRPDLRIVSE